MVGTNRRESRGGETGEETVENRKTTDLPAVREGEAQRLTLITGDANDHKCLGFHCVKPRKVRGRSTRPEERAVLHQAAAESFVCGQELRWAEERLCTMEDSQLATGFGGQLENVAFPVKIMADGETQKLERKDLFQRTDLKVDGGFFFKRSFRRDIVRV